MIKKRLTNFNLEQIADSGQIFRMNKQSDGSYDVISKDKFLKIEENKNGEFCFYCSQNDFDNYWHNFFDLEFDYSKILKNIDKNDEFLSDACKFGSGIRILRQDLFETIISFIISQQNNIPKIKNTIEKLCEKFGEAKKDKETGIRYFAFPKAKDLCKLENLQGLSLGYRDKYISKFSESVYNKEFSLKDLEKEESLEICKKKLLSIYGVGEKVANCIVLFSLHKINAFPIDTWMKKVIEIKYNGRFPFEKYDGYLGIIQQYLFFYAKSLKNLTEN